MAGSEVDMKEEDVFSYCVKGFLEVLNIVEKIFVFQNVANILLVCDKVRIYDEDIIEKDVKGYKKNIISDNLQERDNDGLKAC